MDEVATDGGGFLCIYTRHLVSSVDARHVSLGTWIGGTDIGSGSSKCFDVLRNIPIMSILDIEVL